MGKDLTGLLVVQVDKEEVRKKHPDWLVKFHKFWILKNEIKEELKEFMKEFIWKYAKEKNYELYDEVVVRELPDKFVVYALAYPRTPLGFWKKLRLKKELTPEKFIQKVNEILAQYEFEMITPEIIQRDEEQEILSAINKQKS